MSNSDHKTNVDVAIIGGGVIGLLTAYELVSAGASVTIYERQSLGRESSWAGGGILSPLYPWRYPESVTKLATWSQHRYPDLVVDLMTTTAIDPEYTRSGLLISSSNENDLAVKWSENHKISLKLINSAEIDRIQPGIAGNDSDWIWLPEIAQVRNPRLLQSLRTYLSLKDVKFVENVAIDGFILEKGEISGLRSRADVYTADQYLLAAGAWSGRLLADLGIKLDIEPVRGQMLLLRGHPGLLTRMVLRDSHYLIPRRDGRILVGSTLEYVEFDKSTTDAATQELMSAAESIFPGILSRCEVETQWAGLRPGSPEGVPFIGRHPELGNLVVCAGHFRNGFVLGPASARLAADLLLSQESPLDAADYALTR